MLSSVLEVHHHDLGVTHWLDGVTKFFGCDGMLESGVVWVVGSPA